MRNKYGVFEYERPKKNFLSQNYGILGKKNATYKYRRLQYIFLNQFLMVLYETNMKY